MRVSLPDELDGTWTSGKMLGGGEMKSDVCLVKVSRSAVRKVGGKVGNHPPSIASQAIAILLHRSHMQSRMITLIRDVKL